MPLRDPVPGLRSFVNKSNDVARVTVVVPAGDTVSVSEYVGAQLGPEFADASATPVEAPVLEDLADEEKPKGKAAKKS